MRVAVLDFGNTATGARAAAQVRQTLITELAIEKGISVIDPLMAMAAARGNGFQGSLNLTTEEARDLGAAIGCDFFIIGDADTVKRSPSTGPEYFESYAAIFIVSGRTGRLLSWQRPAQRRANAAEAEQALLKNLTSCPPFCYRLFFPTAFANERSARAAAIEAPAATIELMSDDDNSKGDTRAPRPYRRLKPPYPVEAGLSEVEATVDALVDIDASGEVMKIEIARWAGYGLDQSVIDTVKQMHFFPAMRDGVAIPMRVLLRYNFRRTLPEQSNPDKPKPKIIIKPRP